MKRFYQNESEIPEGLKPYYENRDGGWHLKPVEGLVPKETVDEFRTKNTDLLKTNRDLTDKLKPYEEAGVDVALFKELKAKEQDIRDEKLIKKGELETVVTERTKGIKEEHERQLKAISDAKAIAERDRDAAIMRESKLVIDQGVLTAARKRQLKAGADDLLLAVASRDIKMVDGKPIITGPDGKPAYSKTTGLDMSIEEYVEQFAAAKPMLFEENKGSGSEPGSQGGGGAAGGGSGSQGNPGYNPYHEKTFNMTKQAELVQKNPAEAKRLCLAAGRKWVEPSKPTGKLTGAV